MGLLNSDLIIYGRSIGTGFAIQLVEEIQKITNESISCIILFSPFLSIRKLAYDLLLYSMDEKGKESRLSRLCSSILCYSIRQRLDSENTISKITCPIFIIHGLRDAMIPYEHSKRLHELCNTESSLLLSNHMTHNDYDIHADFIEPVGHFLSTN